MPARTYTTHDIARYCDVYPSSVMNWINDGKLKTYRTVGGHHRVTRQDLVAFLNGLGIPLPPELARASGPRVLIVDDDAGVARVLRRAFARHPARFRVESCGDGVEALIRIGHEPPDLVVLDVVLPKMDGIRVCEAIKKNESTRGVKIVAISGKKTLDGRRPEDALKVDAFFRKPFVLAELVAKAAQLLELDAPSANSKK